MNKIPRTLLAAFAVAALLFVLTDAVSAQEPKPNRFWWPDQIDLSPLRQHAAESNPLGEDFDYAEAFESLDLDAIKTDIEKVLSTRTRFTPECP